MLRQRVVIRVGHRVELFRVGVDYFIIGHD